MAWVSPKVYAILSNSEEGKDIIEKLPDLSQDECDDLVDEFFSNSGKGVSSNDEYIRAKEDEEFEKSVYDEEFGSKKEDNEDTEEEEPEDEWEKAERLVKDNEDFKKLVKLQKDFDNVLEDDRFGERKEDRYENYGKKIEEEQQKYYENLSSLLEENGIDEDEVTISEIVENYAMDYEYKNGESHLGWLNGKKPDGDEDKLPNDETQYKLKMLGRLFDVARNKEEEDFISSLIEEINKKKP